MTPETLLLSLWSGLAAAVMGVIFSAPASAALPCFVGGFVARFARDLLLSAGATPVIATLVAAFLVVISASLLTRRPGLSPVVMVSALLPIGAAGPFFRAIAGFLRLASLPAEQSAGPTVELMTNLSRVFTTTLALAIGVSLAVLFMRWLRVAVRRR
jgi:hypothetical protein